MGQEKIAVMGCTLLAETQGAWVPGNQTTIPIIAPFVKCCDKITLITTLPFISSGCSWAGYNHLSGGGSISPSSQNVKVMNQKPMRENDKGQIEAFTCSGIFIQSSYPFSTAPCNCKVTINNAGQNNVTSS